MRDSVLIRVERASKKFCRNLKRSLWYGLTDLARELTGRSLDKTILRKEEFWSVKDVSFELKRGDTLGLIGPNGAGKTTMLRMLNGLIKPDLGRIEIDGKMQALIALGAGFNPILTGRENIFINAAVLGMPKQEVNRRFDEIVNFSGVEEFIDMPVQSYSSGMAVRLGFAVAAHLDPDILLVDEVLAVGDEGFQVKCLNKIGELRQKGAAIVLVSHNMHTVSTFANRVIVMEKGIHHEYGNVPEGIKAYRKMFMQNGEQDIEKICSKYENISFHQIEINSRVLSPGDSFSISLMYESKSDYVNAEVDIAIWTSNEISFHFQATNKAYNQIIDLRKGTGVLNITIEDIRINNAIGKISVAVWSNNRKELLFWWRIPVEFLGIDYAIGNTFLNVSYKVN